MITFATFSDVVMLARDHFVAHADTDRTSDPVTGEVLPFETHVAACQAVSQLTLNQLVRVAVERADDLKCMARIINEYRFPVRVKMAYFLGLPLPEGTDDVKQHLMHVLEQHMDDIRTELSKLVDIDLRAFPGIREIDDRRWLLLEQDEASK